jgi:hypothetical protein
MRMISFALTTPQFLDGSKTVTRRLGWASLKTGTPLMGVRKAMGLKPGEKIERLGPIRVTSATREPLESITADEVAMEGFPCMTPEEFVTMFCSHMEATPKSIVTRIEFERIANEETP